MTSQALFAVTQRDDEDYIDYIGRLADHYCTNPPPAPDGFELVHCAHEQRHWPMYTVADDTFYKANCGFCAYDSMRQAHAGCEHSHHGRWRRWKITANLATLAYRIGLIKGWAASFDADCRGCLTYVAWRWTS